MQILISKPCHLNIPTMWLCFRNICIYCITYALLPYGQFSLPWSLLIFFLKFFTGKTRCRANLWISFRLYSTNQELCSHISYDHCQAGLKPTVPRQPQIYFYVLLRVPHLQLLKYRNQQQLHNQFMWKHLETSKSEIQQECIKRRD